MRKLASNVPPLHVFMRRAQLLKLFRDFLRAANCLPDASLRVDIRSQVTDSFRYYQTITDAVIIKNLIAEAHRSLNQLHSMGTPREGHHIKPTGAAGAAAANSWMSGGDAEDERGRVGTGWPWSK